MDRELEDLLDSTLNDFETKPAPVRIEKTDDKKEDTQAAAASSKVTIERTNLYVDDIDYDDRPVRKTMPDLKPGLKSTLNSFSSTKQGGAGTSLLDTSSTASNSQDEMKLFDEIFNAEKNKESMKQFKDAFAMFQTGGDDPKMLENFQKVLADLASTDLGDDDDEDDFENIGGFDFLKNLAKPQEPKVTVPKPQEKTPSESSNLNAEAKLDPLKTVLDNMNKNSEKVLKNESFPFGGDFLSSLTSSLNETGDDENLDSASSLMMQPILSMLFSKEILYPSLKLMLENYDKYIAEKKDKLNEEELKKCNDQKDCISKMCQIYEDSKENDSQETKTAQLKNILDLLEKCGMPPQELVPEVNPFEGLGDQVKGGNSCPIS